MRIEEPPMPVTIRVAPLPHFEGLQLPAYETADAAGMDLRAAVPENEPITLKPGERAMVPTGRSVTSSTTTRCAKSRAVR
jgi:dUTPase